jgi:hypothetical protein
MSCRGIDYLNEQTKEAERGPGAPGRDAGEVPAVAWAARKSTREAGAGAPFPHSIAPAHAFRWLDGGRGTGSAERQLGTSWPPKKYVAAPTPKKAGPFHNLSTVPSASAASSFWRTHSDETPGSRCPAADARRRRVRRHLPLRLAHRLHADLLDAQAEEALLLLALPEADLLLLQGPEQTLDLPGFRPGPGPGAVAPRRRGGQRRRPPAHEPGLSGHAGQPPDRLTWVAGPPFDSARPGACSCRPRASRPLLPPHLPRRQGRSAASGRSDSRCRCRLRPAA